MNGPPSKILETFASLDHTAIIYANEPTGLIDRELAAKGLRSLNALAASVADVAVDCSGDLMRFSTRSSCGPQMGTLQ